MSHFIEICKECNAIISQCRCPSEFKTKTFGICKECERKIKMKNCNCEQWQRNKNSYVIEELQRQNLKNCPYCGKDLNEDISDVNEMLILG